jgi:hypothetical protein
MKGWMKMASVEAAETTVEESTDTQYETLVGEASEFVKADNQRQLTGFWRLGQWVNCLPDREYGAKTVEQFSTDLAERSGIKVSTTYMYLAARCNRAFSEVQILKMVTGPRPWSIRNVTYLCCDHVTPDLRKQLVERVEGNEIAQMNIRQVVQEQLGLTTGGARRHSPTVLIRTVSGLAEKFRERLEAADRLGDRLTEMKGPQRLQFKQDVDALLQTLVEAQSALADRIVSLQKLELVDEDGE